MKYLTLVLLPLAIYARVLPSGEDPEARIDDRKAANVNENFLNAFLGNVQGSDPSVQPIHDIEDTDDAKHNTDKDEKDGHDQYEYLNNEVGYFDEEDVEKEAHYYKAAINCREFHYPDATDARKCNAVKLRDFEPDFDMDDPNKKAFCRWDMSFADKNQKQQGCLCPRTKSKCSKKNQCYWFKPKNQEEGNDAECVHNSERFYNILSHLLRKRGKKDFALKIKYSSAAAKGELPYGLFGPAIFPHPEEPYRHVPLPSQGHYGSGDRYDNEPYYGYANDDYMMQNGPSPFGYGDVNGYGGLDSYSHGGYGYDYPGYTGYDAAHGGYNLGYGGYNDGYGGHNVGYGGYNSGYGNGAYGSQSTAGYGNYNGMMHGYGGYQSTPNYHNPSSYPAMNHANPSYNQQYAQPTNYAVQGRATNLGYNQPAQMPPVGANMASAQPVTAMHQGHMPINPPQGINMQYQAQPNTPNQGLSPPLQAAQPMSPVQGIPGVPQGMQPVAPPAVQPMATVQGVPQSMQPVAPPQEINLQETQQSPSPQGVNLPLDVITPVNPLQVEAGPREQQGYIYPTNYGYSNGVQHAPNAYGHYNNQYYSAPIYGAY